MFTPNRNMNFVTLSLSWSTSKGRDTYGYNICRLDDEATGKRYKTCGGGYDMVGTILGEWLVDVMQEELKAIADRAYYSFKQGECKAIQTNNVTGLYGMYAYYNEDGSVKKVSIDGAFGESSIIKIAEALGLIVEYKTEKKRGKGAVRVGFYVSKAN